MTMSRLLFLCLMVCFLTTACGGAATSTPILRATQAPTQTFPALAQALLPTATPKPRQFSPITPAPTRTATSTPAAETPDPDVSAWKSLPVVPQEIDTSLQRVYQRGLELGNDSHAFSIFGDCQTRPGEFFGVYETEAEVVQELPSELQELVAHFEGSFSREAPTTQDGTTPGSLLWTQWHRGEYGCTFAETPVECELRVHRPSFVIIQVGTHYESRNTEYLRKVILQLLDEGVVPILATKADNREKDERINSDMAMLAEEYDLPLWNFWAAVSDLPNRGLYTRDDRPLQGDIYLTEVAQERHRLTGLETLNAVWRAVTEN